MAPGARNSREPTVVSGADRGGWTKNAETQRETRAQRELKVRLLTFHCGSRAGQRIGSTQDSATKCAPDSNRVNAFLGRFECRPRFGSTLYGWNFGSQPDLDTPHLTARPPFPWAVQTDRPTGTHTHRRRGRPGRPGGHWDREATCIGRNKRARLSGIAGSDEVGCGMASKARQWQHAGNNAGNKMDAAGLMRGGGHSRDRGRVRCARTSRAARKTRCPCRPCP